MKEYSKDQKMAMAKVLLDIIYIDRKVDKREINYFEKVKDALGLSADDQFAVVGLNTLYCLCVLKTMDDEQKRHFTIMMREAILADKYIDPKEAKAFYDICEFIKVTGIGLS